MAEFKTEQEQFWHGDFGNEYVDRNKDSQHIRSNIALFAKVFSKMGKINSLLEFGANIGLNLTAINCLISDLDLAAIEINEKAAKQLKENNSGVNIYRKSILDFDEAKTWDLTLIKGVLIHIAPEALQDVYEKLYKHSSRYICVCEYYNPNPVEITYRGHEGRLFKRDFAGEIMDKFPNLELVDYGFTYHRDKNFPQDDVTWFLLKK